MIVNIVLSVLGLFAHSPQGLGKKTKVWFYLQKNLLHETDVKLFPFLLIFERGFSTLIDGAWKSHWCSLKQQKHAALLCLTELLGLLQEADKLCVLLGIILPHSFPLPYLITYTILFPYPLRKQEGKGRVTLFGYYYYCLVLGHCSWREPKGFLLMSSDKLKNKENDINKTLSYDV